MKRSVHFSIPEPCHENWDQMTPNEQGRFCGACRKTVIDFSAMSDQEILNYMSKATSMVCGNFAGDQLNRPMVMQTARPSLGFRYYWSILVSGFLLTSQDVSAQVLKCKTGENAQVAVEKDVQRLSQDPDSRKRLAEAIRNRSKAGAKQLDAVVKDSRTNLPVAHASISIKGVGTVAAANEAGVFNLPDLVNKDSLVLEVSAVGYDKLIYTLMEGNVLPSEFMLAPTSTSLQEVVVTGYGSSAVRGRLGGLGYSISISRLEQVQRNFSDLWPGKKSVTVYPNPASAGSGVKLELNIKTTGEYKLELFDAGGRMLHVQALQVTQPSQVMNLPTQSSWSKGIYWVRVTGVSDRRIYHAKLVLQ